MGYVVDQNGCNYSRDIGRSFILGSRTYYIFGDTFCKTADGNYVGLQNNTASLVLDPGSPLETRYLSINDSGLVNPLVPLSQEERQIEQDNIGSCVKLWGFGGVVEISDGVGLLWYQKTVIHKVGEDQSDDYHGVGLAEIKIKNDAGVLTTTRESGLLFGPKEPRIGSFSALTHGSHVYLWGDYAGDVVLARVEKHLVKHRHGYHFWAGDHWAHKWEEAVPIMKKMQHGAFFRSDLFGPEKAWVFVGVNGWGDSKIRVGASKDLEGPWELTAVCTVDSIYDPGKGFRYCMYPHEWAMDAGQGELLVTFSEQWPGGVIGTKLKFIQSMANRDEL